MGSSEEAAISADTPEPRLLARLSRLDQDDQRRLVTLLAATWLVAWIVAEVLTRRHDVTFVVLFAVAPLIASTVAGWRQVAAFGLAAFVLALASPLFNTGLRWNAGLYTVRTLDVAVIGVVAVAIAIFRTARERQLARVTEVAAAAQAALLPTLLDEFRGLHIATRYRSSNEAALVGGDFFDAVQLPGCTRVVIGDVRGKGLPSVAHAARAIRAFRLYAGSESDISRVGLGMSAYLSAFLSDEDFITALLVDVLDDGTLRMLSCGHPTPFLCSSAGVRMLAVSEHPPLTVAERFGMTLRPDVATHTWSVGDRLLLCTDGLVEARDADGRLLPTEQIGAALGATDSEAVLDQVIEAVDRHTGGRAKDDLALVVLERAATLPRQGVGELRVGVR